LLDIAYGGVHSRRCFLWLWHVEGQKLRDGHRLRPASNSAARGMNNDRNCRVLCMRVKDSDEEQRFCFIRRFELTWVMPRAAELLSAWEAQTTSQVAPSNHNNAWTRTDLQIHIETCLNRTVFLQPNSNDLTRRRQLSSFLISRTAER
jgi:hypothetical protein